MLTFFVLSFWAVFSTASCADLAQVDGFLVDLDGTMYNLEGLIAGAQKLFDWFTQTNKPYVFLSNSGAKGPVGVQAKLNTAPYKISDEPISTIHCYTAAVSVAKFLEENVDPGSYIYFLQSTSEYGGIRDSCIKAVNNTIPHLFYRYHWRTDLSETEAKQWALRAKKVPGSTFVVTCADGEVSDDVDPVSGKPGYVDWSYILLAKATWLIRNGATLVNHAPDTHNFWDSNFPGVNLDAPGPGSFFEFLLSSAYPEGYNRSYTVGKGGNLGTDYSILPGIELLKQQGSSGDLSRIAMVGDTLNTDILAGNQAGIQSVFVLSGVHTEEDLKYYDVHPTCILNNVGEIPAHAAPVFRKIINH